MTTSTRRIHGFTMIEFILVVAISGILILGLSALIEVPRKIAEQESTGDTRLSSADRAIAQLDRDIRFATNVELPNAAHLRLTRHDGAVVDYTWSAARAPLVRTVGGRSSEVLESATRVTFALQTTSVDVGPSSDGALVEAAVETASFETFSLKSGYQFVGGGGAVSTVSVIANTKTIGGASKSGLFFQASGLSDDAGVAASLKVRLRRNGVEDLKVRIYEADSITKLPVRAQPVAYAHVLNGALPSGLSTVSIPLTSVKTLTQGGSYFAELSSDGNGSSADIEYQTLSDADAAGLSSGGFLYSSDGGRSYSPTSSSLDASQSAFDVTVKKTTAVAPTDGVGATDDITTAVQLRLSLPSSLGATTMNVSFPVENNLVLVNR